MNKAFTWRPSLMNPRYPTNVKIPLEYVLLIDENLEQGNLVKFGYKGRAHVVRTAVYEFLVRNEIQPSIHPEEVGQRP
jgi:hypothetical protein